VVSLAFAGACVSSHHQDDQPVVGDDGTHDHGDDLGSGSGSGSGTGSGSSAASCPFGSPTYVTEVITPFGVSPRQDANIALGLAGGVFVAGSVDTPAITNVFLGVDQISPTGTTLTEVLPFGSLVATDATGNLFIAGAFTSRIDFGNGVVLEPMNNDDVFVAEIDVKGNLVFARALNECGDGLSALAVAKDGRIAVSGSGMGTLVLDAKAENLMTLDVSGKVAFESKGELVVAGTVANATDMFVAVFDTSGKQLLEQVFDATSSVVRGIAIDANDHIAIVGWTEDMLDLFGTQILARYSPEVGRVDGAFLLVVDSSLDKVLVSGLEIVEANSVVFDGKGNVYLAGATTSAMVFNRLIAILKVDSGGRITFLSSPTIDNLQGRGLSVGIDACGSLYAAFTHQLMFGVSPITLIVEKFAL
jgi:hypothetical protein